MELDREYGREPSRVRSGTLARPRAWYLVASTWVSAVLPLLNVFKDEVLNPQMFQDQYFLVVVAPQMFQVQHPSQACQAPGEEKPSQL